MKLLDFDIDDQYFHSLYVPGDHHPSLMGSYLSALLHFMSLYKVPVVRKHMYAIYNILDMTSLCMTFMTSYNMTLIILSVR